MLQEYINFLTQPFLEQLWQALIETFILLLIPGLLAAIFGTIFGFCLYICREEQKYFNQQYKTYILYTYKILNFIVNLGRSVPFVILMIAILPVTRILIGTTIGTIAACVPLTIASIPFMARIVENACINVNYGLIEAAKSMGASTTQILFYVILPESIVNIINGIGLMLVALVGYGSVAGTLAGGGLGALAFNYGYQRFNNTIILVTVILIILVVQMIQYLTNFMANYYSN